MEKYKENILGALKSVYEKISGLSADMNIEQAIDLTDKPGSSQKRQRTELETPDATGMQVVLEKLRRLRGNYLSWMNYHKAFSV